MGGQIRSGNQSAASDAESERPVAVVLIEEHELTRGGTRQALSSAGIEVVGEAGTAEAGIELVLETRPDVVVMDIVFADAMNVAAIERLSRLAPASCVIVLTDSKGREELLEAILAGARGYVLKDADAKTIAISVHACARGECVISSKVAGALLERIRDGSDPLAVRDDRSAELIRAVLTERELEIFRRLASGESNREIGRAFSLSEKTVKNHVASILAKLQLENRIQAAVQAVRSGYSCVATIALLEGVSDQTGWPLGVLGWLLGS